MLNDMLTGGAGFLPSTVEKWSTFMVVFLCQQDGPYIITILWIIVSFWNLWGWFSRRWKKVCSRVLSLCTRVLNFKETSKKWQVRHLNLKARPIINWVSDYKTAHENPKLVAVFGFICSHLSGLGTRGLSRNGSWPKSEMPCPNPAPQRTNFMAQGLRRVASCKWHCTSYICVYIYIYVCVCIWHTCIRMRRLINRLIFIFTDVYSIKITTYKYDMHVYIDM